jgi:hypothetical protein
MELAKSAGFQHRIDELEKVLKDQNKAWEGLKSLRPSIIGAGTLDAPISEGEHAAELFEKKYRSLTKDSRLTICHGK